MDWSLIIKIVAAIGPIQEAIRTGGSVMEIIARIIPELKPLLEALGIKLFPEVKPELSGSAAIDVIFDVEGTKWVQNGLNALGEAPPLAVDGRYGKMTTAAVKAYQVKKGEAVVGKADGWAGPRTSGALAVDVAAIATP